MFAEYAAMNKKPIDYTVITGIPADIILIRVQDMIDILDPEELELFKKECRNYPSDEELRKKYYSQKKWDYMRLGVIRRSIELNVTKENSKDRLISLVYIIILTTLKDY